MSTNLLLLSSSRWENTAYLEHAQPFINNFLGDSPKNILFIPFAGVTISYDQYIAKVQEAMADTGYQVSSIHQQDNPEQSIKNADAFMVGGGNTFHLLHQLYQFDLLGLLREQIVKGKPYIGWSAGSNIASPSIMTTNDMPIIQPPSFHALHLVPFQLNPHFLDNANPEGFNGETRSQRLKEFTTLNPHMKVVGLKEGCALQINDNQIQLLGDEPIIVFEQQNQRAITKDQDLQFLLQENNDV